MTTALVRYEPPVGDKLFTRRGLLLELRRWLFELEEEYNREAAALREFERRYKPAVGARYDELVLTCESKAFNCKMSVWQDRQR